MSTAYTYLFIAPDRPGLTWDRIPQFPEDLTWQPWWRALNLNLPHCTHVQLTAYSVGFFRSITTLRHPEAFEHTSDAFHLHPDDHSTLLSLYQRHRNNILVTASWEFL